MPLVVAAALCAAGCAKKVPPAAEPPPPPTETSGTEAAKPPPLETNTVPRMDFNRLAMELALPLFWTSDANGNGALDPDEVAVFWNPGPVKSVDTYVQNGRFTAAFDDAYRAIADRAKNGPTFPEGLSEAERRRRELVVQELAQGRPTLVKTPMGELTEGEELFVRNMLRAADLIERLYAKQLGMDAFAAQVPKDDPASQTLFFRNQGYRCTAPKTQREPGCSAIPSPPAQRVSGLYPQSLLAQEGFCEALQKKGDEALTSPFTVVREGTGGKLEAVPYPKAYAEEMTELARLLDESAAALPEGEPALKAYLTAAAQSFRDNLWPRADEAWAKMNAQNSKWYLRIGPDEVYAEPCNTKALFHMSFARINPDSLKWQAKLDPLKSQMEEAIAKLAGPPYKARTVTFALPDFIDIVLNAGDSRSPSGATIGQSLPNFGPVANEGRGRTVAMTNFYTDPDSLQASENTARSLLCPSVMPHFTTDPAPQLMSTVLHEAAHNLGPSHQYKVKGKVDREVFGGPLASMLEELKAQGAALYYTTWLKDRGVITERDAQLAAVRDLLWAFGHISRGMYDEERHPRTYSQLAAIQLGQLMDAKVVRWNAEGKAANGTDTGCFEIALEKWPAAAKAMLTEAAGVKSRGDRARAEGWVKKYVDVQGEQKRLHDTITERALRAPKATFVYGVEL